MAEGLSNVPDLAKQKEEVSKYLNKKIEKGDTWYLVDTKWFKQWKKYVGYDNWDTGVVGERSSHPGPIDNSSLLKGNSSTDLKEHLIDDLDYILVPEEAWALLKSWYGLAPGQEPIERKVIEYGMFVKHCRVEIYFTELKLCQMNDMEKTISHKFSKIDTLEYVEQVMKKLFNIPPNVETRLWNKYNTSTIERIENKAATLQELGIYQSTIIIEQKTPDGTWPKKTKRTTRSFGNNVSNVSYYDYHGSSSVGAGLCGLGNLGNTCFMNSALQCMSNTPPLTQYFLKDNYWDELNIDNPLGMHGEIAKSYGELIKIIWSGHFAYTIPRNFKMVVGRFAPQFSGYQQQDCQELMAFLLDGLHEDLNRVKRKPYIEIKDADGRPDHIVAREAWDNYLKRNNSIIVDIFHGLLKSTLVCPDCSKVSVTFDPFCYLSLPLPIRKERLIEFIFVGLDPNKRPLQMKVSVPKQGYVSDLCEAASKLTGVAADRLRVADVYSYRFHKVFQKEEPLSSILDRDEIFVYELPPTSSGDDDSPSLIAVPVYMREISFVKNGLNNCTNNLPQLFGQPFLIAIPSKNVTYSTIYNAVLQRLSRFVTTPDANENWWVNSPTDPQNHNGDMDISNGDDCEEEEIDELMDDDNEIDGKLKDSLDNSPPGLFTIVGVNSFGNMNTEKFKNDGSPIELTSKSYIAIDWHPMAKQKFYNEKEAKEYEVHESVSVQRLPNKKTALGLNECLELFTTVERLGAEDPWYCPTCKRHQQATKKFDLWSLPSVLIIHLKRFSYNRYWRDKLDTMVEFPVKGLEMGRYLIDPSRQGPATYDLIAVANHYGGMGGGHYTAYAKNAPSGQWYYFDDSSVTAASEDSLVTKAAYVLFYMKRGSEVNSTIPAPAKSSSPEDDSSTKEDSFMDFNHTSSSSSRSTPELVEV